MKKNIREIMQERALVLDGAMGTQIFAHNPTIEDYGSVEADGCVELLNERRKEWIQDIHASYFNVGADAVETNTFGCNEVVLSEFNLAHRTFDLNVCAARLAREVADSYDKEKFVIGSVGPGTKLVTLLQIDYATLFHSYLTQIKGLLTGGVDAVLIETAQDLNQVKIALRAARIAMKELRRDVPLWAQVTIETTGTMLVGSDIQAALAVIEMFGVDVVGLNCATGPDEMRQHIAYLAQAAPCGVSALPNAGLPQNVGGKTVYPLGPVEFATKVAEMARDFDLNVIGGCCGTTPEHIKELVNLASNGLRVKKRTGNYERSVSSLYTAVPLNLEPRPLFVGERTNANGSKKFRDLLGQNDYDGLTQIAKEQLKEGAHILDVCVAYVSRNETKDMDEFVKRIATQVNLPLMIDSTEAPVIERALQLAPGKCIVNSINFEDGEAKARQILTLCQEYGASVVALTIDEEGMAKTCEKKLEITRRIINLAHGEYKLNLGDIIIDPLTFTLASGEEEFRKSAMATLDGIAGIKKEFPEVRTILGLSNVSFGLNVYPRQILNSMMLYYAVKNGLDLAILNAAKIVPISKIEEDDKTLFSDLIFDKRTENSDPLKLILAKFTDSKQKAATSVNNRSTLSVEERLKLDIIDGEKLKIVDDCHEALKIHPPLHIINRILLEGMKVVGERFGAGEMQLPFVLESAEAMKSAVKTLEPFMEKNASFSKGKAILATVKGDVHDIGKNLVEIILSNNGFDIVNLGIKQPIESILEKYKETGADAIGMSGLLVKSTVIMKENLEYMARHGYTTPVILGGAALTRDFVEKDCAAVYPGPLFFALDAFEGLRVMECLWEAKQNNAKLDVESIRQKLRKQTNQKTSTDTSSSEIKVIRKSNNALPLNKNQQSSWVKPVSTLPKAPFYGTRLVEEPLEHLFQFLDEFSLIRSRFGFTQGSMNEDEFNEVLKTKAYPILSSLKEKLCTENIIQPKAVYGYYPACSENDTVHIYAPDVTHLQKKEDRKILCSILFPRQSSTRRLCIADFFSHVDSGVIDVFPLQIVTMGEEYTAMTQELYKAGKFSEYYYLHGLGTELTEAYAELMHKRIRTELGIHHKDATNLRQLFSQGYQGSRYSFGYPACPDLHGNAALIDLLDAKRIGVTISESFQMDPELTTSALISWHPQARYFSV